SFSNRWCVSSFVRGFMRFSLSSLRGLLPLLLLFLPAPLFAQGQGAQVAWRLLDYMAVDYAGAVGPDGRVLSASEYAEMREFSSSVTQRIAASPIPKRWPPPAAAIGRPIRRCAPEFPIWRRSSRSPPPRSPARSARRKRAR